MQRARGFALVLALFLIVTLAAVGAYMITVSNVQVEAGVMDEQGARAYQAARAGLEWGAYQVLRSGLCTGNNFALPSSGSLAGFRAVVTCTPYAEIEGAGSVTAYVITSTGCNAAVACGGAAVPSYVERQLQLTVTN